MVIHFLLFGGDLSLQTEIKCNYEHYKEQHILLTNIQNSNFFFPQIPLKNIPAAQHNGIFFAARQ